MRVHFNIFLFALLIGLCCCKTQKISDTTNHLAVSSNHIEGTAIINDTTTEQKQAVTENENLEVGIITFVDGGGNYNTQTGEATGVKNVTTTKREKQLQQENELLKKRLNLYITNSLTRDTIYIDSKEHQHKETQAKTNWYWWLIVGFFIGVVSIIILKKLPYTKWLMVWL